MCETLLDAHFEVDHILALWRGGDNSAGNLHALCRNCHGRKTFHEAQAERERRDRERGVALRRAQISEFFEYAASESTPLDLVRFVANTYCGWKHENVNAWLEELGCEVCISKKRRYPAILWRHAFSKAGSVMENELDYPVHGLKLRVSAPFAVPKPAEVKIEDGPKTTLFERFRFHG